MAYSEIWEIEVRHAGLNKYRHIRGRDRYVVEQKAAAQKLAWDEMWEKKKAADQNRKEKEAAIKSKEQKKELATTKTAEAQAELERFASILKHTLSIDDTIDWSSLEDRRPFSLPKPIEPELKAIPPEPQQSSPRYQPRIGFLDKIFTKALKKKIAESEALFAKEHECWNQSRQATEESNAALRSRYAKGLESWEKLKLQHLQKQKERNDLLKEKKLRYLAKDPDSVVDYCEMILGNSEYPDYFPQEWDIEYQPEAKVLIVDYSLPNVESLPTLKAVKYVVASDEFTEQHLSASAINASYDEVLYQTSLRTIHELYEADTADALESIVFNGWVNAIDKATGQAVNSCILSVQASKDEFLAINLEMVDPKACFKALKGIGSSKLHGMSPVPPIANINKEDRRFVSAYAVADQIEAGDNLAAMDWQDFENLIREIFEKEFSQSGGEVKITQASRDGGVDAIVFDPDPIRGGKIVIQAKRYSNVVGVSAVRDLYGTTVNEGAIKGILVTTANFGPDAYEFAKNKPLTLLNGGNLLHLLEKHGHRARIDLQEAKLLMKEKI